MKKHILLLTLIFTGFCAFTQNFDRISISSGGKATDEMNFVIGETFSFSMAGNGNIILEAGTMAGTGNTGGITGNIPISRVADNKNIPCYPNPATEAIFFTLNDKKLTSLNITVFDFTGKLIMSLKTVNADIIKLDLQSITSGSYVTTVLNQQAEVIGSFQFIKQ